MRVLVSGASGLIGTALQAHFADHDHICALLVRGAAAGPIDVRWDPEIGAIDEAALAAGRFDAVVHLAGEPLLGRWTQDRRERILRSREEGTRLLAAALAELPAGVRPRVLVCASATGWYGDRGDDLLTERDERGEGFLAEVVERWEAAADPARDVGIRTVHLRTGVVLARRGGALRQMLLPFRLGVGGPIGFGRQWMPWIGLEETVRVYAFALERDQVEGPVNAVGPTPCTNREYARALGRALHRPAILPVPPAALRLIWGRQLVQETLLASQKVVPARLEAFGYDFAWCDVESTLRHELARH